MNLRQHSKVQQKSPNEMIHFLDELPRDRTALIWVLNPLSKDGCDGVYTRGLLRVKPTGNCKLQEAGEVNHGGSGVR